MNPIHPLTNTTPFPNGLIDEVMPTLRDTEWRLLCVVVRHTLGWRDGSQKGQRKASDWLTHRQLKAQTGRDSEAISKAVDALVKRGIIEVWSDTGKRLTTPHARRRCGGRLYFRLKPLVPKSEVSTLESEIRNPKTTKETQHKISPYGGKRAELPNPDVKQFIHIYIETFKRHTASGDPPPIAWGKDGALVKQLLRVYSYDRLVDLLQQFFASDDTWIRKLGYSIGAFRASIPKLLVAERVTATYRRDPATRRWVKLHEERS